MEKLDDRLECRVSKATKAQIERAAALTGQSATAFVISSAVAKAEEVFKSHFRTELTERDAERFLEILEETEPNPRLRAAAGRYAKWKRKRDG